MRLWLQAIKMCLEIVVPHPVLLQSAKQNKRQTNKTFWYSTPLIAQSYLGYVTFWTMNPAWDFKSARKGFWKRGTDKLQNSSSHCRYSIYTIFLCFYAKRGLHFYHLQLISCLNFYRIHTIYVVTWRRGPLKVKGVFGKWYAHGKVLEWIQLKQSADADCNYWCFTRYTTFPFAYFLTKRFTKTVLTTVTWHPPIT